MAIVFEATAVATFNDPSLGHFERIFDFGAGQEADNIWLGSTYYSNDMAFEVHQGGVAYRITAPGAIVNGESATWRVTAEDDGTLSLYKNGALVASQTFGAAAVPTDVDRPSGLIGSSNWAVDDPLNGTVDSLAVDTTLTSGITITDPASLELVGALTMTGQADVLDASGATTGVTLDAGGGDDVLGGGGGDDVLTGGTGDDVFTLSGGDDVLTDFGTGNDSLDSSALSDVGAGGTNQDGTVTANEVTVSGGGGAPQVLTFPSGETVTVPDGTVDTSTPKAQFDSLVAMGVPPCFAAGTRIATPGGPVAVEALRPGDLLLTADNGPRRLRWIGRREEPLDGAPARRRPVEIKPGALGPGIPAARLRLSPLHRVLVEGPEGAVLAPAGGLLRLGGVRSMRGRRSIVYYVLLLDRHEVIFAEGAAVESFRPGPVAMAGFEAHVRARIHAIMPGLKGDPTGGLGPPARPLLSMTAARALAEARRRGPADPAPAPFQTGAAAAKSGTDRLAPACGAAPCPSSPSSSSA